MISARNFHLFEVFLLFAVVFQPVAISAQLSNESGKGIVKVARVTATISRPVSTRQIFKHGDKKNAYQPKRYVRTIACDGSAKPNAPRCHAILIEME